MQGCRILHPEFRPRREEEEAKENAGDPVEGKKPIEDKQIQAKILKSGKVVGSIRNTKMECGTG